MCSELSAAGRQYVVEEIQLALQGMKHMKEMVQKTEENHKHLMEALTHSYEKKMVLCCCFYAQPK